MCDRHSGDDPCRTEMPDGFDRAEHGPTRVHGVVHHKDRVALQAVGKGSSPALQVRFQCQALLSSDSMDFRLSQTYLSNQRLIQVEFALMGDIAEDGFLLPRD